MGERVPPGIWAAAQARGLLAVDLPLTTMRIVNGARGVRGLGSGAKGKAADAL